MTKLSAWYRGHQSSHRSKLGKPMTDAKMVSDPELTALSKMREDRALLERRACQYAAFIAERDGLLKESAGAYTAWFDGQSKVAFTLSATRRRMGHEFVLTIPDHILKFNPDALEPETPPPAPERCAGTVDLEEAIAATEKKHGH